MSTTAACSASSAGWCSGRDHDRRADPGRRWCGRRRRRPSSMVGAGSRRRTDGAPTARSSGSPSRSASSHISSVKPYSRLLGVDHVRWVAQIEVEPDVHRSHEQYDKLDQCRVVHRRRPIFAPSSNRGRAESADGPCPSTTTPVWRFSRLPAVVVSRSSRCRPGCANPTSGRRSAPSPSWPTPRSVGRWRRRSPPTVRWSPPSSASNSRAVLAPPMSPIAVGGRRRTATPTSATAVAS